MTAILYDRGKLKSGRRPIVQNVKHFKPGEVLFKEGEFGREMFVIKSGEVKILKNSESGFVQLAKIGSGSIIGEMSLLDNLPRSATVEASDKTSVTVINELVFNSVMEKLPVWLKAIVKIVVSRLRDANKIVGKSLLKNKISGVAALLELLFKKQALITGEEAALEFSKASDIACFTCRISPPEFRAVVADLFKRKIVLAKKNQKDEIYLICSDKEALSLFVEFLHLKAQGKKMVGSHLSEEVLTVLDHITYSAQKSGVSHGPGTLLPVDILKQELPQFNPNILQDLYRNQILAFNNDPEHGEAGAVIFEAKKIRRIQKINKWIKTFEMTFSK